MDKKSKYKTYIKCLKCKDKIPIDTNKKMTDCKCKAVAVDGCEYYTRIIGNKEDWKEIRIKL
jgi:hypothetical protein